MVTLKRLQPIPGTIITDDSVGDVIVNGCIVGTFVELDPGYFYAQVDATGEDIHATSEAELKTFFRYRWHGRDDEMPLR